MEGQVDVGGISMHYEETGAGPAILLLHGLGGSCFTWQALRQHLPGHRLVALDLKGHGQSDKPPDRRYAIADQAALVSDFIAALDLRELVIVGQSYGGGVALQTALLLQDAENRHLRGLVLLDSVGYPQKMPTFAKILRIPLIGELSLRLNPPEASARAIVELAYFDTDKVTDEVVNSAAHCMSLPGAHRALIATVRQIIPRNIEQVIARYPTIKAPTLITWGDHDRIVPIEVGQKLAQAIPGARLEVLKDCGHVPQEELPAETAQLIAGFLSGL